MNALLNLHGTNSTYFKFERLITIGKLGREGGHTGQCWLGPLDGLMISPKTHTQSSYKIQFATSFVLWHCMNNVVVSHSVQEGPINSQKVLPLNVQVCLSKTESISTHKSKRNPDFSGNLIISSYMGASGLGFIGMFSQATAVRSPILNYGLTRPKHMCGLCKPSTRKQGIK